MVCSSYIVRRSQYRLSQQLSFLLSSPPPPSSSFIYLETW